mmetsp:Transcript_4794/g.19550  ORF Transcript_4794/g.19550 Transcript_4794/m.19550 type:complete len:572 (-) Transcript_4794:2382-4097(-)
MVAAAAAATDSRLPSRCERWARVQHRVGVCVVVVVVRLLPLPCRAPRRVVSVRRRRPLRLGGRHRGHVAVVVARARRSPRRRSPRRRSRAPPAGLLVIVVIIVVIIIVDRLVVVVVVVRPHKRRLGLLRRRARPFGLDRRGEADYRGGGARLLLLAGRRGPRLEALGAARRRRRAAAALRRGRRPGGGPPGRVLGEGLEQVPERRGVLGAQEARLLQLEHDDLGRRRRRRRRSASTSSRGGAAVAVGGGGRRPAAVVGVVVEDRRRSRRRRRLLGRALRVARRLDRVALRRGRHDDRLVVVVVVVQGRQAAGRTEETARDVGLPANREGRHREDDVTGRRGRRVAAAAQVDAAVPLSRVGVPARRLEEAPALQAGAATRQGARSRSRRLVFEDVNRGGTPPARRVVHEGRRRRGGRGVLRTTGARPSRLKAHRVRFSSARGSRRRRVRVLEARRASRTLTVAARAARHRLRRPGRRRAAAARPARARDARRQSGSAARSRGGVSFAAAAAERRIPPRVVRVLVVVVGAAPARAAVRARHRAPSARARATGVAVGRPRRRPLRGRRVVRCQQ